MEVVCILCVVGCAHEFCIMLCMIECVDLEYDIIWDEFKI